MTQMSSKKNVILDHAVTLRHNMRNAPAYFLPLFVFTVLCASVMWVDSNQAMLASQSQAQVQVQGQGQIQEQVQNEDDPPSVSFVKEYPSTTSSSSSTSSSQSTNTVTRNNSSHKKPIMYTFWESVPGGCCGADEEGHQQLLDSWRKAWESNGWETKLLSMEDARRHPDFKRMDDTFKDKEISEYDKRCFFRWLAMGTLPEGGWISDYDMFPLGFSGEESYDLVDQNDNGRFTSYAYVAPALMYASREEWQRLINMLIEAIPPFEGLLTDMYVFKKLVDEDKEAVGIIYDPDIVASRIGFMNYVQRGKLDCDTLNKQKAIHLSHYRTSLSFELGVFPLVEVSPIQERGHAAAILMDDYQTQCVGA